VNQLARLRELTGFHGIFGKAIDYDDGGYGIAILSRWRITAAAFAPLPVEIKDSVARSKYEARGALVTKISSPWGMIRVIDTHLDATRSDSNRVQQAKTLASLANAERDSGFTILGGDFNSEPASVVMQMLSNAGWKDLFAECGRGIPYSFPADVPAKRIDYLLSAGDAACASASVIDTRASDHRPVLFELISGSHR
jgi:endonuclease/exonuclease/phosphatase family metal-dependent hydrolase